MNEQLVVKNFGPFQEKEAKVTFKKVTVFIGPTGGGKSTLAKLKAIIGEGKVFNKGQIFSDLLAQYGIESYRKKNHRIGWINSKGTKLSINDNVISIDEGAVESLLKTRLEDDTKEFIENQVLQRLQGSSNKFSTPEELANVRTRVASALEILLDSAYLQGFYLLKDHTHYILAERLIVATLNSAWPSLLDAKVTLPKPLLDFTKSYLEASAQIHSLIIPFLDIEYNFVGEKSFVRVLSDEQILPIDEVARSC